MRTKQQVKDMLAAFELIIPKIRQALADEENWTEIEVNKIIDNPPDRIYPEPMECGISYKVSIRWPKCKRVFPDDTINRDYAISMGIPEDKLDELFGAAKKVGVPIGLNCRCNLTLEATESE